MEITKHLSSVCYLFTGHWCTPYHNKNLCRL